MTESGIVKLKYAFDFCKETQIKNIAADSIYIVIYLV